MIKKLINKIQHWVLPYTCILCGMTKDNQRDLCLACKHELPWMQQDYLRSTQENSSQYDKAFALFEYQKPIDKLIINLKFYKKLLYAKVLGELMAESLINFYQNDNLPEVIIPVPLHSQRLKERGFNQALELAKPIAKKLSIPIDIKICQRIRYTQPQSLISGLERKKNLKNAFKVNPSCSIKHLAIIDDVITTGYTIQELSLALRKVSVQRIDIWSCAKV